jgi:hypothetical protein
MTKISLLGLGSPSAQDRNHPMSNMMPYITTGDKFMNYQLSAILSYQKTKANTVLWQ